jgi:hypothetical protein
MQALDDLFLTNVQVSVLNGDKKMTSTIDATPAGIS